MRAKLTSTQVQDLIENVDESFPHEACGTCECFLGDLTQLEVDADGTGITNLKSYRRERNEVHTCLGCVPCPLGDQYAQYILGS